jgi:hypothetical protein
MHKYKDDWIKNHEKNHLLNTRIDWKLNMLWSEKIFFVKETIEQKYFETEYYGWCDIGYFRNVTVNLQLWPNNSKILSLNKNKVHYAKVNLDKQYTNSLMRLILNKNSKGLPSVPIPENQVSIAGGFFILHKEKIDWWSNIYDSKISLYFSNDYLVKDDQIIIIDSIFSEPNHFLLYEENDSRYDNWFMFQRILM